MHVDKELARRSSASLRPSHPETVSLEPFLPDIVSTVLDGGIVSRRILFPESGGYQVSEVWQRPTQLDSETQFAIGSYLAELHAYLAPASRSALLSRILALLSHYRLEAHSPQVEACIADDWADDLGKYPLWAVNLAARNWRRAKKFKPQISEMIEICEGAVKDLNCVYSRLRSIVSYCDLTGHDEIA